MDRPVKLLIIDDNEEILAALYDFFIKEDYDVASAADGLEGLKLLENEKKGFDLVITDIVMPHISGVGVISIIKKKPTFSAIKKALKPLPFFNERWNSVLAAGKIHESPTRNNRSKIYYQKIGITSNDAHKIIRLTSTRSNIPEVLRVAQLLASGFWSI